MALTVLDKTQVNVAESPNILINGGFDFWQRQTSFAALPDSTYTADRWKIQDFGTPVTGTIARTTTEIDVASGSGSAMKIVITGVAGNAGWGVYQLVENYLDYSLRTVTVHMRMACSASGMQLYMSDGVGTVTLPIASNSSTYTTYTLSLTLANAPTMLKVGLLTTGVGVVGNWWLDNWMMVMGDQAVRYVPRPTQLELAMCQRYFCKSYDLLTPPGTSLGSAQTMIRAVGGTHNANTEAYGFVPFPVFMRASPTVLTYDQVGTAAKLLTVSATNVSTIVAVTLDDINLMGFSPLQQTSVNALAYFMYKADAEL